MGKVTVVKKNSPGPAPGVLRYYIGRPSVLGNDWTHLDYGLGKYRVATREAAIAEWEKWIRREYLTNPLVHHALETLARMAQEYDVELACWCAPLACHGDVLKRLIEPLPTVLSRDDELEDSDGNLRGDRE
mgnify:CR=1